MNTPSLRACDVIDYWKLSRPFSSAMLTALRDSERSLQDVGQASCWPCAAELARVVRSTDEFHYGLTTMMSRHSSLARFLAVPTS